MAEMWAKEVYEQLKAHGNETLGCLSCIEAWATDIAREARAAAILEAAKVFDRLADGYHFAGMLAQERQVRDHCAKVRALSSAGGTPGTAFNRDDTHSDECYAANINRKMGGHENQCECGDGAAKGKPPCVFCKHVEPHTRIQLSRDRWMGCMVDGCNCRADEGDSAAPRNR